MFVFVAILMISVSTTAQEKWNSFDSEMGKFSIDFYGDVSVSERITEKAMTYKTTFSSDYMSVLVSSSKHIKLLDSNDLKISVDSFIDSIKGTIVSKEEIEDDGVKGIFAVITLNEGATLVEYKVYINKNYQYQVMAYAEKVFYNQKRADRCFDSFKIVD